MKTNIRITLFFLMFTICSLNTLFCIGRWSTDYRYLWIDILAVILTLLSYWIGIEEKLSTQKQDQDGQ